MNSPAIIHKSKNEYLTLSDFDQCMLFTEEITNPIRLRNLKKSVKRSKRFRNVRLTQKGFDDFLAMCLRRYPGSKTMACMYELNETNDWAFKTYQQGIPEMLDALTTAIRPIPSFTSAVANLRALNHRFGIVSHSHRQLIWGMSEHMGISAYMDKDNDIFDIVDLNNQGKHTGIGWLGVMDHFQPQLYKERNWLDDCLKNHRLPGINGFTRFYINPTEPSEGLVDYRYSAFTEAMGRIALNTTLRQAA